MNGPGGQPLGTVNAPRTQHDGLEAGAQIAITKSVTWRSSYLWSRFRFDNNASYGDNALPGIPEHFYRGELTWAPARGYFVTLNTEWSPRRYAVDMAHTLFADPYAIFGLKVGRNEEVGHLVVPRGPQPRRTARMRPTTGVIADARGLDAAQFLPGDGPRGVRAEFPGGRSKGGGNALEIENRQADARQPRRDGDGVDGTPEKAISGGGSTAASSTPE